MQQQNNYNLLKPVHIVRVDKIDEHKQKILLNHNNNGEEFWLTINSNIAYSHANFPRNFYFDTQTVQMQISEFTLALFREITLIFDNIESSDVLDPSIFDGPDDNLCVWVADGLCAWPSMGIKLVDIQINKHSFSSYFTMLPLNNSVAVKLHHRSPLSSCRDVYVNDPSIEGLDLDGIAQIPTKSFTIKSFKNRTSTTICPILHDIQNELYDPKFKMNCPRNLLMFDNRPTANATTFFDIHTTSQYPVHILDIDMTESVLDGGVSQIKKTFVNFWKSAELNIGLVQMVLTKCMLKFSQSNGIKVCAREKDIPQLNTMLNEWHSVTFGVAERENNSNNNNNNNHLKRKASDDLDKDFITKTIGRKSIIKEIEKKISR